MLFILTPGVINCRKRLQRLEPAPSTSDSPHPWWAAGSAQAQGRTAAGRGAQGMFPTMLGLNFPTSCPVLSKVAIQPLLLCCCPDVPLIMHQPFSPCSICSPRALEEYQVPGRSTSGRSSQASASRHRSHQSQCAGCLLPAEGLWEVEGWGAVALPLGTRAASSPSTGTPRTAAAIACLNPVTGWNKLSYLSTHGYF